jgi:WD40 repeat protein
MRMSYADHVSMSPSPRRTSSDRLLSPPRVHAPRFLTPRDETLRPAASSPLFKGSVCKNLFPNNSKEPCFSADQSSIPRRAAKKRHLPGSPSAKILLPDIPSDFYLSPLDWSRTDILAMASLSDTAFISPKTRLVHNQPGTPFDPTSLKFDSDGLLLAIGNDHGRLAVYSVTDGQQVRSFGLFESSVLCSDWAGSVVLSGSRDGQFAALDLRAMRPVVLSSVHAEEICSVRCHRDRPHVFATSSNDATVKIWDIRRIERPTAVYGGHSSAVRAVCWCPHCPDVIASGGGTFDKSIRIWNATSGETLTTVNTGSQICNLFWSPEYNELLSTHGFSQHQLALWRGADLSPIAQFYEHKQRVLFMAASPDATRVATAAPGDDIRIWNMFPSKRRTLVDSLVMLR